MRDFIINSVKYWADEYHIDGFRFDLMAIHDIETMNEVAAELKKSIPTYLSTAKAGPQVTLPSPLKTRVEGQCVTDASSSRVQRRLA